MAQEIVGGAVSVPYTCKTLGLSSYCCFSFMPFIYMPYRHHTQADTHQLIVGQNDMLRVPHDIALDTGDVFIQANPLPQPVKERAVVSDAPLADLSGECSGFLQSQGGQNRSDEKK